MDPQHQARASTRGVAGWASWVVNRMGRYGLILGGLVLLLVVVVAVELADPAPLALSRDESSFAGTADAFRSLLFVSAATGLISLAVVQTIKYVFNARGWFHRNELEQYFAGKAYAELRDALNESSFNRRYTGRAEEWKSRWQDTGMAKSRQHLRYVWSLPLEQLTGQLAAAAELALMKENRPHYQHMLKVLVGSSPEEEGTAPRPMSEMESPELAERAQRGIDIIQIVVGHRWRWFIRALSMFLCAPIAWVVVSFADLEGSARVLTVVVATVLGGFLSWFARDLSAAVESRRR